MRRTLSLALLPFAASAFLTIGNAWAAEEGSWPNFGGDLGNTHNAEDEISISPSTAGSLAVKWIYETAPEGEFADVSVPPALADGVLYFPDWAGNLHAVDAESGTEIWSRSLAEISGGEILLSRNTPAIMGDTLILGSQIDFAVFNLTGARMMAVDRATGDKVWSAQVGDHPWSIITQSPVVVGNRLVVGVSSVEEVAASFPGYPCCNFIGSVVALNANDGAMMWQTFMAPGATPLPGRDPAGYSGNSVWGGMPTVDVESDTVFIVTGNNYHVPPDVLDCQQDKLDGVKPPEFECDAPDNYVNSFVAVDLKNGKIKWAAKLGGFDAWNVACGGIPGFPENPENCPDPAGPDFDYGEGTMIIDTTIGGEPRKLVVAGQKSGIFWAVDAGTGELVWQTATGPGGLTGGMIWGSATDGERIYVANSNSAKIKYKLVNKTKGSKGQTTGGIWSALDAATGEILWQNADPTGSTDTGSVTVANGVVFLGSFEAGMMRALDAATGQQLWEFSTDGAFVNGSPTVSDGVVYWGAGYSRGAPVGGTNKFWAFEVD